VNNAGLDDGDSLDIQSNCLDFGTAGTADSVALATLQGRGVSVLSGFQVNCP
jgi:hypothetical protein